ncbi:hypothetical protein BgiBS90_008941, partial [Biomphalaria glabrata]
NQKVLETTRGARDYPRPQETTRGRKRLPEAARDYQRPQETTRGRERLPEVPTSGSFARSFRIILNYST